jgi:hypothetical protein
MNDVSLLAPQDLAAKKLATRTVTDKRSRSVNEPGTSAARRRKNGLHYARAGPTAGERPPPAARPPAAPRPRPTPGQRSDFRPSQHLGDRHQGIADRRTERIVRAHRVRAGRDPEGPARRPRFRPGRVPGHLQAEGGDAVAQHVVVGQEVGQGPRTTRSPPACRGAPPWWPRSRRSAARRSGISAEARKPLVDEHGPEARNSSRVPDVRNRRS